jgi:hypothetical protein
VLTSTDLAVERKESWIEFGMSRWITGNTEPHPIVLVSLANQDILLAPTQCPLESLFPFERATWLTGQLSHHQLDRVFLVSFELGNVLSIKLFEDAIDSRLSNASLRGSGKDITVVAFPIANHGRQDE